MKNTRPLKVMFTTAALAAALTGCGSDSDSTPADGGAGGLDTNAAPVISSTVVRSLLENTDYSYTFAATDAEDDNLVYSATTLPSWLTFNADTGVLSGTAGDAGSHDVVLSVTDGENVVTETFTISIEIDDGSVFTIFKDSVASGWAAWGEGGQLPVQATDGNATYGEVFEFANMEGGVFDAGKTVNGFSASLLKQGAGVAIDASAYKEAGSIQFDLKMTAAPAATDVWYFKVESSAGQSGGQEFVIDTPVLDEWVHYVIPLNLISDDNVAELINLMVFPKWGDNEGARFSMDNLQIFPTTPYTDLRTPLEGDVVLLDDTLADGWAIWQDSNAAPADNTIAVIQDDELGAVIGLTSIGEEVAGITTLSSKVNGLPDAPLDASAFAGGTLHFDMKLTAATAAPFDTWVVKLEGAAVGEASIPAPVLGEWMHYSVDVAPFGDLSAVNNIMIFPAWSGDAAGAAYSVDNITFSTEAPAAPVVEVVVPTAAAVAPTVNDADVFVLYSDSNAVDQAILEYQVWWNEPTKTDEVIEGNNFLKFAIKADGGSGGLVLGSEEAPIDASDYVGIRFDMFVEEAVVSAQFKMVAGGEGIAIPVTAKSEWVSVEIPFSDFNVGAVDTIDTAALGTMGVILLGPAGSAIYMDNIYFYKTGGEPTVDDATPTVAATAPTVDDADVFVLYSDTLVVDQAIAEYADWWNMPTKTEETIDGNTFVKLQLNVAGGSTGLQLGAIDASAYTGIRFDMFVTAGITEAQFKLVAGGEAIATPVTAKGEWVSVELAFTDFTIGAVGVIDPAAVAQLGVILHGEVGDSIYFDNMYFY